MEKVFTPSDLYERLKEGAKQFHQEATHFSILNVADLLLPYPKKVKYRRRSFFKISVVSGHSKIHYGYNTYEIMKHALVFTNPLIPYEWERLSEDQHGFICMFTDDFLGRFGNPLDFSVFNSVDNGVILLEDELVKKFEGYFIRMNTELNSHYTHRYDLLRCIVLDLIHESQKLLPSSSHIFHGTNAHERIALHFLDLLENQFPIQSSGQHIQLNKPSQFANKLHLHVNHLNKALKEITGKTTSQLIAERIIQEAVILLKSTDWSVTEIAWCLGFEEPNNFSSFFKRFRKTSPKQLRMEKID